VGAVLTAHDHRVARPPRRQGQARRPV